MGARTHYLGARRYSLFPIFFGSKRIEQIYSKDVGSNKKGNLLIPKSSKLKRIKEREGEETKIKDQ
jgi:hypothetical protein